MFPLVFRPKCYQGVGSPGQRTSVYIKGQQDSIATTGERHQAEALIARHRLFLAVLDEPSTVGGKRQNRCHAIGTWCQGLEWGMGKNCPSDSA
ncbi:hypothetical protein MAPG_05119 [Magnaporthiopsis poae ATCC 64411]|uniref:Uncharacterized protein n=1 Tax=Magnaporthiopsis poae (strain ATCC 64411 / 73-15) TaxID=644358 RepID=A0A0C4DYJ7_MAGP6|nr:hypothetical protein MAPG_05119 [Magnaporthiopsis poae ATCC 64411]